MIRFSFAWIRGAGPPVQPWRCINLNIAIDLPNPNTRSVRRAAAEFKSGSHEKSATSPSNLLQKGDLAGITAERGCLVGNPG